MPRPRKCRRICVMPENNRFGPLGKNLLDVAPIILNLDEYETIRLIDLLGLTQEECALQMDVARTTVQAIYNTARRKLALALVDGKALHIEGGDYTLCGQSSSCCGKNCNRQGCSHKRCSTKGQENCLSPLSETTKHGGNQNENCSYL